MGIEVDFRSRIKYGVKKFLSVQKIPKVKVVVIPTDERIHDAADTMELTGKDKIKSHKVTNSSEDFFRFFTKKNSFRN